MVFEISQIYQVLTGCSDLNETCVGRKFAARPRLWVGLCETTNKRWKWVYSKMAYVPEPGFRKYWRRALSSLRSKSHDITNKYPEAASVVQQVHKVIIDNEIVAKCIPARVGESSHKGMVRSDRSKSALMFFSLQEYTQQNRLSKF
jgi:hypothetical protein